MESKSNTIERRIKPVLAGVASLIIASPVGMREATEMLSQANRALDAITAEREKVTKPLNEALKAERARFKPYEKMLEDAITTIRMRMGAYQTAETKRKMQEEAEIAARVGPGKGKLKAETAIKKMEAIEHPDTQVATESGMVKFRTVQKLKITDESKIPREYLIPDEGRILMLLKKKEIIPGCEISEEQIPINYR